MSLVNNIKDSIIQNVQREREREREREDGWMDWQTDWILLHTMSSSKNVFKLIIESQCLIVHSGNLLIMIIMGWLENWLALFFFFFFGGGGVFGCPLYFLYVQYSFSNTITLYLRQLQHLELPPVYQDTNLLGIPLLYVATSPLDIHMTSWRAWYSDLRKSLISWTVSW